MISQLYAVCLIVENFNKSVKFYTEKLDLRINYQSDNFADFKLNNISIAIFQKQAATDMFPIRHMNNGGGCVLAFQVENIEASIEKLQSNGIIFFENLKTTPWGQKVAYFQDPDKNIWEISEKS